MWTEANNLSRSFPSCLPIRSSIQKTFSYYEGITSVQESTGYMGFMMNVVVVSVSNFGRHSATLSTVYLVLRSLTTKLFACMAAWVLSWVRWNKLPTLQGHVTFQTLVFCVISSGQILIHLLLWVLFWNVRQIQSPLLSTTFPFFGSRDGMKMTAAFLSLSAEMLFGNFSVVMTLILLFERIKSLRMAMNFSQGGS